MASASPVADVTAGGRRTVCEFTAAVQLQHRDRLALSAVRAAGAGAAVRRFSYALAERAAGQFASRACVFRRGDRAPGGALWNYDSACQPSIHSVARALKKLQH